MKEVANRGQTTLDQMLEKLATTRISVAVIGVAVSRIGH
jgi:hypothetical protein